MKDSYYWGTTHRGMKTKEAFIEGFLTIPLGILSVAILICGLFLIGGSLLWVIQWIYENMP
ncbi:hypothetical protein B2J90_29580 (plasmid) [Bacillus tropicus]|nr:hypothetical protein B2J90_29580 [Bacillus cereus]